MNKFGFLDNILGISQWKILDFLVIFWIYLWFVLYFWVIFLISHLMQSCVGHTAWAPEGREGRRQAGPIGRRAAN